LLTTEARTPSRSLTRTLRKSLHAKRLREGLDSFRVPRGANRDQADPAVLPGPGAVRRSFWGASDRAGIVSAGRNRCSKARRGQSRSRPDPVLLFGAAVCGSPNANDPGAEAISEGQAHLRATPREDERNSSAQTEPTLTSEAILLFGATRLDLFEQHLVRRHVRVKSIRSSSDNRDVGASAICRFRLSGCPTATSLMSYCIGKTSVCKRPRN
jgi:hypothetical protein